MSKQKILGISEEIKLLNHVDASIRTNGIAVKYGTALSSVSTIKMRTSSLECLDVLRNAECERKESPQV